MLFASLRRLISVFLLLPSLFLPLPPSPYCSPCIPRGPQIPDGEPPESQVTVPLPPGSGRKQGLQGRRWKGGWESALPWGLPNTPPPTPVACQPGTSPQSPLCHPPPGSEGLSCTLIPLHSDLSFFFLCFLNFNFYFYWSIVALQHCVTFCCTAKRIIHSYTYIPTFLDFLPI